VWPWGHLAVAYLLYTLGYRLRATRPTGRATVALAVGTQLPDLVDKPLAVVGVLPAGRSLAHSLLFVVPLAAVAVALATRRGVPQAGWAFALGVGSHPPADAWQALRDGSLDGADYLLWPLRPVSTSGETVGTYVDASRELAASAGPTAGWDPTGGFGLQLVLFALVGWLWLDAGRPGPDYLRSLVDRAGPWLRGARD